MSNKSNLYSATTLAATGMLWLVQVRPPMLIRLKLLLPEQVQTVKRPKPKLDDDIN